MHLTFGYSTWATTSLGNGLHSSLGLFGFTYLRAFS